MKTINRNLILSRASSRKIKRICFSLLFVFISLSTFGQNDYSWWDVKNNWVRGTHWHEYITIAPGFMGPNALPVPDIKNGLAPKETTLKFALEKHSSDGDETENLFADLYIPLYSKKVGFRIYGVPFEQYKMDTLTRDKRSARDYNGKGNSYGDVYFSTYIQLLEDHKFWPDFLLTLNFKTASGNQLSAARFTDAPAYFFDLSFGKTVAIKHDFFQSIRPHAMLGFFAWQTYEDNRRQNDAPVFGVGIDINTPRVDISNAFGGYDGHNSFGDHALVYRLTVKSKFDSAFNYELRLQNGFADFEYTSFQLGCSINISKIKQENKKSK